MNDKSFSQADLDAAVTAAVATARTEATNQLNALKAEQETATKAAVAGAKAEGAKAERERISGILSSEEAKGKGKSALHLAMTTSFSLEEVKGALAGLPKEASSAAGAGSHGLFLIEEPSSPKDAKAADDMWSGVVADINKKNAPK